MSESHEDLLAALAVGAASLDEAAELAGKLAADEESREIFAHYERAAQCLALAASADASILDRDTKARIRARIAAAAELQPVSRGSAYTTLVPADRLRQFSPGIEWAVLPGKGMTVVYWVFTPPACGDLPLETHVHAQSGYVLDGDFTLLDAGGQHRRLRTGDRYAIPSGAGHGAIFHSRTVLCDVYVPKREDFELMYHERKD